MIVIFFRRPILTLGLFLLAGGGAGLAGGQGEALAGYRLAEGAAAGLIAVTGLALVIWDVSRWLGSAGGPRERSWEPVIDEGVVQAINGNWDVATLQFQSAMQMAGPDPQKLRAAERIGGYLESRGKVLDAIPYLHTALATRYRIFGPTHPATRTLQERLARLHRSAGDPAGAAQLLAADLDAVAPGGRVITLEGARVASLLAEALYDTGDTAMAYELSQKAIAAIEQKDPYSSELVNALVVSARFAAANGDDADAEARLQRAMECANRSAADDKLNMARKGLIDLYVKTGRSELAIPLSEKVLRAGTSTVKGPDMDETARMNRQHADLLEQAGRLEDAIRFRRLADTLERLGRGPAAETAPSQSAAGA